MFRAIVTSLLSFLIAVATTALLAAPPESGGRAQMLGYTDAAGARERTLEQRFDKAVDPALMRDWLKTMSSQPNQVGSPHDRENAEFMLKLFRSWGFDAHLAEYRVLFPTPRERVLEMTAPRAFSASLREPVLKADSTSAVRDHELPPYNAYAADGDVTASLVYVSYGIPDDYKELERRGVSVKGRIVLARYGGSWRGIKPKLAYEHGAVGCILYSDPRDDGFYQGETYPNGPFRSKDGVQRGSVLDMPLYPGDPLTPGRPATAGVARLPRAQAPTLVKIPVLPVSWSDALPLLKALSGPVAPPSWRGALPVTYHIGPGPARVHLKVSFDWNLVTAYDVIARIVGSEYPDQWVLRGNHHDGWVFGAADPLSGNVALMAEARALGELLKTGWRPKRTIVYASWDAEEPGLIGSTEWVEAHAADLRNKAVIYINSDTNGRGFLDVGGSHSLQAFINEVGRGINDPETGANVIERERARREVAAQDPEAPETVKEAAVRAAAGGDLRIGALGSGSDYTPFLQHLGVASLDLAYNGEDQGGSYHSLYDSFDHFIRFGDPTFQYETTLSKTAGHAILRFADADILPYRYGEFANNVGIYVHELKSELKKERNQAKKLDRLVQNHSFTLAADPTQTNVPPKSVPPVPAMDFSPLDRAVKLLRRRASAYDDAMDKALAEGTTDTESLHKLNTLLQGMEPALTRDSGLPGRPWFRHMIYAPGFYTGYGVKTLPAIREAIEQKDWKQANRFVEIIADLLNRYSEKLEQAAALVGRSSTR